MGTDRIEGPPLARAAREVGRVLATIVVGAIVLALVLAVFAGLVALLIG